MVKNCKKVFLETVMLLFPREDLTRYLVQLEICQKFPGLALALEISCRGLNLRCLMGKGSKVFD